MVTSVSSNSVSTWSNSLFSKLDTKNQGYIDKSGLQSALSQVSGNSTDSSTNDVDNLFKQLDGDSDGKITKSELSTALSKVADQLNRQFDHSRMRHAGGGHMPPSPPPGDGNQGMDGTSSSGTTGAADTTGAGSVDFGEAMPSSNDAGFTKDELTSQLKDIDSTDSKRSKLISSLVENFDAADTDGNDKISGSEAHAYDRKTNSVNASAIGATALGQNDEAKAMMKLMHLLHAYGSAQEEQSTDTSSSSLSAIA